MNPKKIAVVAVFTALTVVLVLSPAKIPAPYAPFLKYQIWEIPIVTAFISYGPLVGVLIAVINTMILLGVYPGDLPTGPLYNLAAVLSMLLGIYIIQRFIFERSSGRRKKILGVVSSTALGTILRVGVMSIVNWAFLRYPYPVGFSIPVEAITALLPVIGFFNATLAIYTIPISYFLERAMSYGTKSL
ncbi:ECF transporter S component [Candidatus Bathyarchaeota archaeon]|nr:ECF transporter S component [Candidatus Bathyarchaeota archaeon]